MRKNRKSQNLKSALIVVLTAGLALCGCGNENAEEKQETTIEEVTAVSKQDVSQEAISETNTVEEKYEESVTSQPSVEEDDTQKESEDLVMGSSIENKQQIIMPESLADQIIIEVPEWEPITVPESQAVQFVADMGVGWNLGNTFDAIDCNVNNELDYESAWVGTKTTRENVQTLAEAGFHTIRIPVSWHNHLVDENYLISEAWLDRVQEVVDWAVAENMYVILNIHHDNNTECIYPDYEHLDQSIDYVRTIWEQLAERFADYDEHLIFETMNEPRLVGTDKEWWVDVNSDLGKETLDCINQLNQAAVDTIRENAKGYNNKRYIMVPGYCAAAEFALANGFELPKDDKAEADNRILVSVHAYTPYNFALASENDSSSTDVFSIENKKGTGDIDAFMKKLYDKYVSQGIGVVIGEYGARAKGDNLEARTEFTAYYVARARYYGMTACWWDNHAFTGDGENFGLLRRMKSVFMYPQIVAQMVYYSQMR